MEPIHPDDLRVEPHWDGGLLLTIAGTPYRISLLTAWTLVQQLLKESAKARRLILPDPHLPIKRAALRNAASKRI